MSLLIKLHGWEQDRQGQELGDKGIWEVTEQGKAEGSDTPAYPPPPQFLEPITATLKTF